MIFVGTGKTVVLRAICQTFKTFFKKGKKIPGDATVVLKIAPTGSAAFNIRGTYQSFNIVILKLVKIHTLIYIIIKYTE